MGWIWAVAAVAYMSNASNMLRVKCQTKDSPTICSFCSASKCFEYREPQGNVAPGLQPSDSWSDHAIHDRVDYVDFGCIDMDDCDDLPIVPVESEYYIYTQRTQLQMITYSQLTINTMKNDYSIFDSAKCKSKPPAHACMLMCVDVC